MSVTDVGRLFAALARTWRLSDRRKNLLDVAMRVAYQAGRAHGYADAVGCVEQSAVSLRRTGDHIAYGTRQDAELLTTENGIEIEDND